MNHCRTINKRLLALLLTFVLVLQCAMPATTLAEQRAVDVDNHTFATDQTATVSDIRIDDVDAPVANSALDDTAKVTTAQDVSWDIPVLWVRDDLQICKGTDAAEKDHTYLPALAFFVPQDYALDGSTFTVTLSDSLTQLFGTQDILSVHDASTGITYILPASIKDLFARTEHTARAERATRADVISFVPESTASVASDFAARPARDAKEEPLGYGDADSILDIFCAQTARDALTDEDLEWLLKLILDYLQPQAVELLLDSFPDFRKAADAGEIGQEIGLYVYYLRGDDDGLPEHRADPGALAYVSADAVRVDGELAYCYMLAVNIDSLLQKDEDNQPVRNEKTGKYLLVREGEDMDTLCNTVVHELFHALMHDYNRTGMAGGRDIAAVVTDSNGDFSSHEALELYHTYRYPKWFTEGSASAVENAYQFNYSLFQLLRKQQDEFGRFGLGDPDPTFTPQGILSNYLKAWQSPDDFAYLNLGFAKGGTDADGDTIDTLPSRYVSGYLATLYLSELSARYLYNGESSITTVDNVPTVDAYMLRGGLNALLRWMHEDSTLDDLINSLSPKDEDGNPIYADTAEFEEKFIKGTKKADDTWTGDEDSLEFVNGFLNYMLRLDAGLPEGRHPNGSILFDFDQDYTSPLDTGKESSSEFLKIVNSNCYVKSTVKGDSIDIGAGKSDPTKAKGDAREADDTQPAAAAKAAKAAKAEKSTKAAATQAKRTPKASKTSDKGTAVDASATDDKNTPGNMAAAGSTSAAGAKDSATSSDVTDDDGTTTRKDVAATDTEAATVPETNANVVVGSDDSTGVRQAEQAEHAEHATPTEDAAPCDPATHTPNLQASPAPEPAAYEGAPSSTVGPAPAEPAPTGPAPSEPAQQAAAEE